MDLNPKHKEFFKSEASIINFHGGAGAGKSFSVPDKITLLGTVYKKLNRKLNIVVLRKTLPSNRRTSWKFVRERLKYHGIPFTENKSQCELYFFDHTVYFMSCNNATEIEKLKSLTDIDFIWVEEAHEITKEVFEELDRRLRGGEGIFGQIVLTFNPILITHWINKTFFNSEEYKGRVHNIRVTVEDNPYLLEKDPEYIKKLDATQFTNPGYYKVYRLGLWGTLENAVYPNFDIFDIWPAVDETVYGLDFGFTNPMAMLKAGIRDNEIFEEEVIYEKGMKTSDLIARMRVENIPENAIIYADCADPGRIKEIYDAGYTGITPCIKDKVENDIAYVSQFRIHMDSGSPNLLKENASYVRRKDREGNLTETPIAVDNHLMDCRKYIVCTHFRNRITNPAVTFGSIDKLDLNDIANEYIIKQNDFNF